MLTPKPEQVTPIYIVLYSEQLIVSTLEAILFYEELFWDLTEHCGDLIEYAVLQLDALDTKAAFNNAEISLTHSDTLIVIKTIRKFINHFNCCSSISCMAILRYIVINLDKVSVEASRIYEIHDLPMIIANILDKDLRTVRNEGKIYKIVNNKWNEWLPSDPVLSTVECHTWLLLHQLLWNPTAKTAYSFTNCRKETLTKLLYLLHDGLIDQLSPLAELKTFLHKLSTSGPQETFNNPILHGMDCTYQDELLNKYQDNWKEIALKSASLLLYPDRDNLVYIIKSFLYSIRDTEETAQNLKSCSVCTMTTSRRCSKCLKVWYCSRKCQIADWKYHKLLCHE